MILSFVSDAINEGLSIREKEKETEKAINEKADSSDLKPEQNIVEEKPELEAKKVANNTEKKKRIRKKINKKEE